MENIQIARLGLPSCYRYMMGMFLSRLAKNGTIERQYDLIVDCVSGKPLAVDKYTQLPVVPLVFHLDRGLRAVEEAPGPMIAVHEEAYAELCMAGVPEKVIVRASFGTDCARFTPDAEAASPNLIVAVGKNLRLIRRAEKRLKKEGFSFAVHSLPVGALNDSLRLSAYRKAAFGICEARFERESLHMAACGIPVLCPATMLGREYVRHEETGLLYTPGDVDQLAEYMKRWLGETELLRRLGQNAREDAQNRSWDKTASLVLATLENL